MNGLLVPSKSQGIQSPLRQASVGGAQSHHVPLVALDISLRHLWRAQGWNDAAGALGPEGQGVHVRGGHDGRGAKGGKIGPSRYQHCLVPTYQGR